MMRCFINCWVMCVVLVVTVVASEEVHQGCKCVAPEVCRDWAIGPRDKNTKCEGEFVCCYVIAEPPPPPPQPQCSVQNPQVVPGFVEGHHFAKFGEFPWMVNIFGSEGLLGTGALIDPWRVLTVAHLLQNNEGPMSVRIGAWNDGVEVVITRDTFQSQVIGVKDVKVHPHFNDVMLYNDIAILYLQQPVNVSGDGASPQIGTVCLPSKPMEGHSHCVLSTFGHREVPMIRKLNLFTIHGLQCQDRMRNSVLGKSFLLDKKSFLCAMEEGKDACKGDGGAPLVCRMGERYELAGLVSWGLTPNDCNSPNKGEFPGVYLNVFNYLGWIEGNK